MQPEVYVPLADNTQNRMAFVVRATGGADAVLATARAQVLAVDKDLVLTEVTTLADLVQASVGDQRFRTMLLSGFAGVALFHHHTLQARRIPGEQDEPADLVLPRTERARRAEEEAAARPQNPVGLAEDGDRIGHVLEDGIGVDEVERIRCVGKRFSDALS